MFKSKEIRLRRDSALDEVRWRASSLGLQALNQAELIALLLAGGGDAPLVTAATLISKHGSLARLAEVPQAVLTREKGMGCATAWRLAAAFEIGARCRGCTVPAGRPISGPADLVPLLMEEFRAGDRERFLALHLDTRHRLTAMETVSVGTLNASLVHPREVFRNAVRRSSAAVIAAHNHPSGCCEPSREDLELTRRLDACGRLLGIELLDHVIVGADTALSLRERGWPASDEHWSDAADAQEG